MKTSLLPLFAGVAFLACSAIANAGEPMTLTSAELDAVTAGGPQVNVSIIHQVAIANAWAFNGDATAVAFNIASVTQENED